MIRNLIAFEGPDGCGKTTIIKLLKEQLVCKNNISNVLFTREPGGTEFAESCRELLFNNKLSPLVELHLITAGRLHHLNELDLNSNIVFTDRYVLSTMVYQGKNYTMKSKIKSIIDNETYLPELTFFIDVNPMIGMARLNNDGVKINRLDPKDYDQYRDIRDDYIKAINELYPTRLGKAIYNGNSSYTYTNENKDKLIYIDSSDMNEEQVLDIVLKHLMIENINSRFIKVGEIECSEEKN